MRDASTTSPAGTTPFTPVHRCTGERLDLRISSEVSIPRGCTWRRIVKDLKTGTLYRAWNKECTSEGCMCDAYAEEIETPTLATVTSPAPSSGPCLLCLQGNSEAVICDDCFNNAGEILTDNAQVLAAVPHLLEHLRNIVEMAHSASAIWENGDLAFAARNLDRIATAAEMVIAKAEGRACPF